MTQHPEIRFVFAPCPIAIVRIMGLRDAGYIVYSDLRLKPYMQRRTSLAFIQVYMARILISEIFFVLFSHAILIRNSQTYGFQRCRKCCSGMR